MEDAVIYERFSQIFQEAFDDDRIVAVRGLSAKDVDGWDSLTHVRLLLTVEKAFKIKFSTSEINKLETVEGLVALIKVRH